MDTEPICTSATVAIGQPVTYVDRRLEGGSISFHDGVVTAIGPAAKTVDIAIRTVMRGRQTVTVWDQWHGDGLPYAMPADEASAAA
ncbi:hypothetical protein [Micrococcus yunnanensis]|uniref:hypothetical protein n=1 Tax=Micrococcus yunnanensis TaxID=566027 RepID=UPI00106932D2|nr:hypothetical protein [Micrococcus yunnanensis]MCV7494851.1 hypothetical protein [Micrococcus luteus]TFE80629.1 hypothetical protein E2F93_08875 [Micrococcus yunnanensis]